MRIAHLSDPHILEPDVALRPALRQIRLQYLSLFRPVDYRGRFSRFQRALERAKKLGFDHLVISGDLTEEGTEAQFQEVARALDEARIAPERLTLVPGNHDAYADRRAWKRALEGPLRPYAATSATGPGEAFKRVIDLGDAVLLPISTAVHQHWSTSAGSIDAADWETLERRACDAALAKKAVVVVQHHPPLPHSFTPMQWIDGLRGYGRLVALLSRARTLQVLHGHLHRAVTKVLELGGFSRIFAAPAVVDDGEPRVRIYETHRGLIVPA